MSKKLTKIGNSHGIIIDKGILDMLGITPDTELDVRTDGRNLVIMPRGEPDRRQREFRSALERTMRKHAGTFRKLAK